MKTRNVSKFIFALFLPVFTSICGAASYGRESVDEEEIFQAANYMYYGYIDSSKVIGKSQPVTVLVAWWLKPGVCEDDDSVPESERCFGYEFVQAPNISQAFIESRKILFNKELLIYGLSWSDTFKQETIEAKSIKVQVGISDQAISRDFIYVLDNSGDQTKTEAFDAGYSLYILSSACCE